MSEKQPHEASERQVAGEILCNSDVTALYTAYRAYIVHEDDLINQRVTWSLTAQAVMLGAFAYLYNARLDMMTVVPTPDRADIEQLKENLTTYPRLALQQLKLSQYDFLLSRICWAGVALSLISFLAVLAAWTAMNSIKKRITDKPDLVSARMIELYPGLTGGGSRLAHYTGFIYPISSQALLVIFWLYAMVAIV
jgi:hypothetical protein